MCVTNARPLRRLACLVATLLIAAPALAEPPRGGASFHEWIFGRGRLGIRVQSLSAELREHFGAPTDRGVLVAEVESGRPAEAAGLRVGDVILAVGDDAVESPSRLARLVRHAPSGATLTLEVVRKGETERIDVVPDDAAPILDDEMKEWAERFGRNLEEGGRHLERRLEQLQRDIEQRLRELEDDGAGQKTSWDLLRSRGDERWRWRPGAL